MSSSAVVKIGQKTGPKLSPIPPIGQNGLKLPKITHNIPKWSIMTHNVHNGQFWVMLDQFGQFWAIWEPFWTILGYFGLFWANFYNCTGDHINEQKLKHDLYHQML